jgi:hypothetical protein
LSEYDIDEETADRVNASNYDIADIIATLDREEDEVEEET